jgi:hypothetical protein
MISLLASRLQAGQDNPAGDRIGGQFNDDLAARWNREAPRRAFAAAPMN